MRSSSPLTPLLVACLAAGMATPAAAGVPRYAVPSPVLVEYSFLNPPGSTSADAAAHWAIAAVRERQGLTMSVERFRGDDPAHCFVSDYNWDGVSPRTEVLSRFHVSGYCPAPSSTFAPPCDAARGAFLRLSGGDSISCDSSDVRQEWTRYTWRAVHACFVLSIAGQKSVSCDHAMIEVSLLRWNVGAWTPDFLALIGGDFDEFARTTPDSAASPLNQTAASRTARLQLTPLLDARGETTALAVASDGLGPAHLELFDVQGRRLLDLRIRESSAGIERIALDHLRARAGLAWARLAAGGREVTCRLRLHD